MLIKRTTQAFVFNHPPASTRSVHPDWHGHPSWLSGLDGLHAYHYWVSEVLMPIAFQWIEDHKKDVYQNISADNEDDMGVVVAAAFELVKTMSVYQNGVKNAKAYAAGPFNPAGINPIWSEITEEIRDATAKAFNDQVGVLKDTIR